MSDFFVILVFETVITLQRDSLISNTSQASNSNIIAQTLDFIDGL